MMRTTRKHERGAAARRGFTLIELLLVIAVISLLIGLLIVALGHVRRTGEFARTEKLMRSVDMGLSQFKADHGFLPPLLDDTISGSGGKELLPYPIDRSDDIYYYSELTLAPYLIGVGDLNGDGAVDQYDDGVEGAGFRDPGSDRSWGYSFVGQNGRGRKPYWTSKEKVIGSERQIPGPTYGPYIDPNVEKQVVYGKNRANVPLQWNNSGNRQVGLFTIADYWGGSIRYYRNWPKDLPQNRTLQQEVPVWFGSLRPDQVESFITQTRSVEYIIMSTGPDAKAHNDKINAPENKDNIVRAQS